MESRREHIESAAADKGQRVVVPLGLGMGIITSHLNKIILLRNLLMSLRLGRTSLHRASSLMTISRKLSKYKLD
jgi:hypothetical protein